MYMDLTDTYFGKESNMSNIYVARQPIFDKNLNLFGYELLYRKSQNNFFEETDDDQATASVLDNSFFIGLGELTDNTRAFINFSGNLLLDETPLILPPNNVVVEILERVDITESIVERCKQLKARGYKIALDDFILSDDYEAFEPLIEYVDIIKIDNFKDLERLKHPFFKRQRKKITFLAEKIETFDEFMLAGKLGYSLFQGFFFSKPIIFKAKEISTLNINLIAMLEELGNPEPDHKMIVELFERDLGLFYKLLRIINSAYFGLRHEIKSIHQALAFMGIKELSRWVHLMLIKGVQNVDNSELVKASLVRGKILSLLAVNASKKKNETDYFITGTFSSIDVLLHDTMQNILNKLPLKADVTNALLGKDNHLRRALDAILYFEKAEWDRMDRLLNDLKISRDHFMSLYVEAVKWQRSFSYD
jgi:EAL and modified HD-GYP domain-containing signal transduction protein